MQLAAFSGNQPCMLGTDSRNNGKPSCLTTEASNAARVGALVAAIKPKNGRSA